MPRFSKRGGEDEASETITMDAEGCVVEVELIQEKSGRGMR